VDAAGGDILSAAQDPNKLGDVPEDLTAVGGYPAIRKTEQDLPLETLPAKLDALDASASVGLDRGISAPALPTHPSPASPAPRPASAYPVGSVVRAAMEETSAYGGTHPGALLLPRAPRVLRPPPVDACQLLRRGASDDEEEPQSRGSAAEAEDARNQDRRGGGSSDERIGRPRSGSVPNAETAGDALSETGTSPPTRSSWTWGWGGLPVRKTVEQPAPAPATEARGPADKDEAAPTDKRDAPAAGRSVTITIPPSPTHQGATAAVVPDQLLPRCVLAPAGAVVSPADVKVELALCGDLLPTTGSAATAANVDAIFDQHRVTYEQFAAQPTLLGQPNLLVRIDGRILRWPAAAPLLVSLLAFQRPLPADAMSTLLLRDAASSSTDQVESGAGQERRDAGTPAKWLTCDRGKARFCASRSW